MVGQNLYLLLMSRILPVQTELYMGLINKVDMVCLSPVGYGV